VKPKDVARVTAIPTTPEVRYGSLPARKEFMRTTMEVRQVHKLGLRVKCIKMYVNFCSLSRAHLGFTCPSSRNSYLSWTPRRGASFIVQVPSLHQYNQIAHTYLRLRLSLPTSIIHQVQRMQPIWGAYENSSTCCCQKKCALG
jgi:hypothetical protein